jgi:hypothetical protein
MNIKLPWELKSVYLGALWDNGLIEEEEEDEEMTEARQDRLRVSKLSKLDVESSDTYSSILMKPLER